jgi:PAS domain S-box-containing protein
MDKTGTVYGIMNTAADVTDLNLANKRIEFSEQSLRKLSEKQASLAAIVNLSDDIIISKTLNGIITSWNPAAERLFGYSEGEAIGRHISIIIPADRIQEEDYIISQIRNGKKVDHFDTVRVNKNGKELQLSLTISPVIDGKGVIIGASKIGRDISAQVAAQQSAGKYTERLEIMYFCFIAVSAYSLCVHQPFRPKMIKESAKNKWMTTNTFVAGLASCKRPQTSSAAITPKPTTLPKTMAFLALDGPSLRTVQSSIAIPNKGLPKTRRYVINSGEGSDGTAPTPKTSGIRIKPRPATVR